MIELSLLKALANKDNYQKYLSLINTKTLSPKSILMLKDYQQYFESRNEVENIDFNDFSTFFFIEKHPNLDEKSVIFYKEVIIQLQNMSKEDISCSQLITSFQQQELYNQLHQDLDNNLDIKEIHTKINSFCESMHKLDKDDSESMDLIKALESSNRANGLKWRLNCLQEHFNGGLIKGDFGIIAGYVDVGKTSFLSSELSYMAQQLEGDDYIAWLNTEGSWESILTRIYCATLGCTIEDLRTYSKKAIEKYKEKMKGDINRIKVMNFQRKSVRDVENLIKKKPPSIIVFDLLDHIRGFDKYMGKDGNMTERYGALYQWAREIATQHCPVLAISQLNGDGNNEPYPSITNLRGSRVDKQGAATFQLIIGGLEGNSTERYLSMPKNKISSNKGWRAQVKFNPQKCRFEG